MSLSSFTVADLTKEERDQLEEISRRKVELLDEIQSIQDELRSVNSQIEELDGFADDSHTRRKQLMAGKRKFNLDPEKGLRYMFDHHILVLLQQRLRRRLINSL